MKYMIVSLIIAISGLSYAQENTNDDMDLQNSVNQEEPQQPEDYLEEVPQEDVVPSEPSQMDQTEPLEMAPEDESSLSD